jgi:hypothetical protein
VAAGRPLARRRLRAWPVHGLALLALGAVTGPASAQPAPPAQPADCIVLDDLATSTVGRFPTGWEARADDGRRVYRVGEEGGRRFLRAVSEGLGIQAARETPSWSLATHPVLTWWWRPRQFPAGADERRAQTNDSALAVYMGVPHSRIRGPKAVKYVWSARVPVGTRLSSNNGLTQILVLRSGAPTSRDAWVEERVNAREDWRTLFEESAVPSPGGIAVLTDADDTRSVAAGDYAGFRACRKG